MKTNGAVLSTLMSQTALLSRIRSWIRPPPRLVSLRHSRLPCRVAAVLELDLALGLIEGLLKVPVVHGLVVGATGQVIHQHSEVDGDDCVVLLIGPSFSVPAATLRDERALSSRSTGNSNATGGIGPVRALLNVRTLPPSVKAQLRKHLQPVLLYERQELERRPAWALGTGFPLLNRRLARVQIAGKDRLAHMVVLA